MQIHHGIAGLQELPAGSVLSIGNFDGIHRGHRSIVTLAHGLRSTAGIALVTFEPHPLTVLRPEAAPPTLTPLPLKQSILESLGVDHLVILPPTPEVLNLSAESFWQILRDQVRPSHLIEGESFTFGKGRGGSIERLRQWTANTAVQLHVVQPVNVPLLDLHVVPISSSLIRWLLLNGRARDAGICLAAPYLLQGIVIKGFQRGRELGIPTANLDCGAQLIPAEGVYIGRCTVNGTTYPAAISIGTMETFGKNSQQVEVHLIGFNGDLYGQTLRVEVKDWLREQWEFPTIDSLLARMRVDLEQTRQRSQLELTRAIARLIS